jgi:succinate dehydrogenase/fumarate reductase-like Fe-S protein
MYGSTWITFATVLINVSDGSASTTPPSSACVACVACVRACVRADWSSASSLTRACRVWIDGYWHQNSSFTINGTHCCLIFTGVPERMAP